MMPCKLSLVCQHTPDPKLAARILAQIITTSKDPEPRVDQGTSILHEEVDANQVLLSENAGGAVDVANVLLMLSGCSCGNALIDLFATEVVTIFLQHGDEMVCSLPTTSISPVRTVCSSMTNSVGIE